MRADTEFRNGSTDGRTADRESSVQKLAVQFRRKFSAWGCKI